MKNHPAIGQKCRGICQLDSLLPHPTAECIDKVHIWNFFEADKIQSPPLRYPTYAEFMDKVYILNHVLKVSPPSPTRDRL